MGTAILEKSSKSTSRTPSPIPQNWKEEDSYTSNQMIDTYFQGFKDGKDEIFNKLNKQLRLNIKKATTVSEKIFTEAKSKNVAFKSIHLKAEDIYNFNALFIIDQEDFLNDKFKNILKIARNFKEEATKENFYISINFAPFSENLNEKAILADGFFLKYDKK